MHRLEKPTIPLCMVCVLQGFNASSDCLVSVVACVDTLAVTTGEVSTPFNTALFYL